MNANSLLSGVLDVVASSDLKVPNLKMLVLSFSLPRKPPIKISKKPKYHLARKNAGKVNMLSAEDFFYRQKGKVYYSTQLTIKRLH